MSWAGIRTALETKLNGVSGIGAVHDYQRHIEDEEALRSIAVSGGKINAFFISRERAGEEEEAQQQNFRTHLAVIRGVMALDDSAGTEKTFSDLLEAICDALRSDNDLSGAAEMSGPPQIRLEGHTNFAGALCHYGEITVEIGEDKTF